MTGGEELGKRQPLLLVGSELGGEPDLAIPTGPVEGFDPYRVAGGDEAPVFPGYDEGVHAV